MGKFQAKVVAFDLLRKQIFLQMEIYQNANVQN